MIKSAFSTMIAFLLTACLYCPSVAEAAPYPTGPVTMTAGANPGSGFDLTIRSVVDALQKEHIVNVPLPVHNRPGGSGADFLATMVQHNRGADNQVAVTSLSMMVNQLSGKSSYGYRDVTMIARLMTEYYAVVTLPGSAFTNLNDVMSAITSDPAGVVVGAAHDDEAPFDLLVSAAGGDPSTIHYVTHEGGGDQNAALRREHVDVAIGGVSEFIDQIGSGDLMALGLLAENRLPGLDVPTAREQGLDVTLSNWRGLYGPPDMPPYAVEYWQTALARMVESPTWQHISERGHFTTTFMTGDQFQTFLATTQEDVKTALEAAAHR
ncbi:tripartite tricarboxylate transporter substrate binding protein [Mycobacterium sp. IDR2000157661]|uniref:tripartite tricarboxylate transporter substrate binding protein n=1 Tax=Mycobacterium sp. IDR2000157661 TaxID=2867005 RepID=UPI001EEAC1D1|nr:tripartite tricarboxylate transporter substrate-binding protein [Mycobacterium sp. IDR2000157661]ULE33248.1 tripartite tricarboxylate transporter substrate binding protein [Mycobacterium sp. IDR2000157661]